MEARVLGDYRLEAPLGRGAMGVVWRAVHRRRGIRVAVKTLPPDRSTSTLDALQREVRAIGRLDHPHIVALYDQGTTEGVPWLAMELADSVLQAPNHFHGVRKALDEILAGLAAAHAAGLLHLDIKPSNVLVRDGSHLLADFGISHGLSTGEARGVWGSPAYMAPEAFDGRTERMSRATDLYSVGCLAWTLVTGTPPFAGSPRDLADAHRTVPIPHLSPRLPVPPGFEGWLGSLLRKRPTERFQSASDARRALAALPDVAIAASTDRPLPLGPTLTTCTDQHPMEVAALEPRVDPPRAPHCPEAWPTAPPVDGWARGCGLVGILAVPWLDRPDAQAHLWDALRALYRGRPSQLSLGGPHGAGRSRLLDRFLDEAHRHAGAETLRLDGPLGPCLRRTFGDDVETLALRFARRVEDVETLADRMREDPAAALEAIPALLRAPLVVGIDHALPHPRLEGLDALVVRVVDGAADLALRPLGDKDTRRLLAAWASLDPQAVADVCNATDGDLDASVALVADGIREGHFVQSERGWRPSDARKLRVPDHHLARWAPQVASLRAELLDEDLRPIAVLQHPGAQARTDRQQLTLRALETLGWLREGEWVSSMGRRALQNALGHLEAEHLAAADALEGWDRGEHLFAAGRVDEASHLLLAEAWRAAARGRMSRVQAVLGRLGPAMAHVPEDDPRWGHLHCGLARLGPTHQGYAASAGHAQRAIELARAHGHRGGWADVARSAIGHLLFHADIRLHPSGTGPLIDEFDRLGNDNAHGHDLAAWIHLREGDANSAMRDAYAAGAIGHRHGDAYRVMISRLLYWIAAHAAGHPEAEPHYAEHSQAFLKAGYLSAEMDAAVAWGDMLRRDGDLDEAADRYAHALRVAAEGEARADVGPFLGAALCERAIGRPERALDLLGAARAQLTDGGPSWVALVDLYEAWARSDAGRAVDHDAARRAAATLEQAGYLDRDVLSAFAGLAAAGVAADALEATHARGLATIEAFRRAEASRGPMPDYPDTDDGWALADQERAAT